MSDKQLIPAIEVRLGGLLESIRRQEADAARNRAKICPTITLSREYGCEAYPVALRLKELMELKTGVSWGLMDKALLEEVARNHQVSEELLHGLGEKTRFLDEILATFSVRWKSERDHFRLIVKHMVNLAEKGNVILVGRGGAIITQNMKNCHHFRMYASHEFKVRSISKRLGIAREEAEPLIERRQKVRDNFIRDFLDRDARDLKYYAMVFNNDKSTADRIAMTIADYVSGVCSE